MNTMTSKTVLFIILVAISGLSFGEECASGWTPYGDKCYLFSADELSWKKALESCENEMSTLASVTDSNNNNNLWRDDGKRDWIGLQTTYNKDKWYWNDGTEFVNGSLFRWVDDEPNSGDVCARLKQDLKQDFKIAGRECSYSRFYFICQAESNPGSWNQIGEYWFYFSSEQGHFYYASKYCSDMGGYLARTEVFNALGSDQYDSQREYWIGLSRWYWTDGSQYVWHNFMSYEDKVDGPGICYVLHGTENKWESRSCMETNHYICQKEKSTSPTTTTPTTTTSLLPTNPITTKPTTSTSTTSASTTSTTTKTLPDITPSPKLSTTTKDKSIETSSSTMASVADNDSVSDLAVHVTSTDQTTVVVSSGEAKGLFDGDSVLLYTLIVICALIIVLVVIIIVLVVLSRRRVNKQSDKERLHTDAGDGENQQMAQLPGPSSQSTVQMNRHANTTYGGNTATEQTWPTASDGVPIYAVPNKKLAQLPGPSSQSTAQMNRHANTTHGGNTATEQTSPTASDGVPIYAVPNKKKAETEML